MSFFRQMARNVSCTFFDANGGAGYFRPNSKVPSVRCIYGCSFALAIISSNHFIYFYLHRTSAVWLPRLSSTVTVTTPASPALTTAMASP